MPTLTRQLDKNFTQSENKLEIIQKFLKYLRLSDHTTEIWISRSLIDD